jgi:hypothetical protein
MHAKMLKLAEGMGFEPTIGCYTYNGLANRRLQPLGHPSAGRAYWAEDKDLPDPTRRMHASSTGRAGPPSSDPSPVTSRTDQATRQTNSIW